MNAPTRSFDAARVVSAACPWSVRLHCPHATSPLPEAETSELTERLKEHLGEPGVTALLTLKGVSSPNALMLSCEVAVCAMPEWALVIEKVIARAEAMAAIEERPAEAPLPERSASLPFFELLAPFLGVARERLSRRCETDLFEPNAVRDMEHALLSQLARLTAETLSLQLIVEKSLRSTPTQRLFDSIEGDVEVEKRVYRSLVERIKKGGFQAIFAAEPVLARLSGLAVLAWVSATEELVGRYAADRSLLRGTLVDEDEDDRVSGVDAGLSDPHAGGRSVSVLTLRSGRRLVYKPRSLHLEHAYNSLIDDLNRAGLPLPLRATSVLPRDGYGWVAYVEHEPCTSPDEVRGFFYRTGELLFLTHVLGGIDCHCENLIASGEHPVIIDQETMFHPELAPSESNAYVVAAQQLSRSPLRTGLLPRWEVDESQWTAFDISALGATDDAAYSSRRVALPAREHNASGKFVESARPRGNVAYLKAEKQRAKDHVEDVLKGYADAFTWLLGRRDSLFSERELRRRFSTLDARVLLRNTRTYGSLIERSLWPEHLRSGIRHSIELLQSPKGEYLLLPAAIVLAELADLERMDVPYFTTATEEMTLSKRDADTREYATPIQLASPIFVEAGFERSLRLLRGMKDDDLTEHTAVIRMSFDMHRERVPMVRKVERRDLTSEPSEAVFPRGRGLSIAREIANQILKRAVRANDGSRSWLIVEYLPSMHLCQIQPAGPALYTGAAGIALFFAALYRCTGEEVYRRECHSILGPVLHHIVEGPRGGSIGGCTGTGSLIYALCNIGVLLRDDELIRAAERAALTVTEERIQSDTVFDVIGGAAGALLGLLALYETTGHDVALDRSVACATHLLKHRSPLALGGFGWKTSGEKMFAGFAHGGSGIAYALARLYGHTGRAIHKEAALDTIRGERTFFDEEAANWLDLRFCEGKGPGEVFGGSFCHGAPGIALSRLGCLSTLGDDAVRDDLRTGLATTSHFRYGILSLCCGAVGFIEVFLKAYQILREPSLLTEANRWATLVAETVDDGVSDEQSFLYNPTFFQGYAGLGYMLLRMDYPAELPSVLLWEAADAGVQS